ncbi:unnamed protein product [Notodromas monacha]|uniref:Uncharacterized protein n=1 Tax=Notodromas monacha TaxID=399045 RepID=A0A7R9BVI8_9CRUS|nr:unnamed protein product [Notodromas monacha]CAG0922557.1 unnamed protein product [Notodromas monacha]
MTEAPTNATTHAQPDQIAEFVPRTTPNKDNDARQQQQSPTLDPPVRLRATISGTRTGRGCSASPGATAPADPQAPDHQRHLRDPVLGSFGRLQPIGRRQPKGGDFVGLRPRGNPSVASSLGYTAQQHLHANPEADRAPGLPHCDAYLRGGVTKADLISTSLWTAENPPKAGDCKSLPDVKVCICSRDLCNSAMTLKSSFYASIIALVAFLYETQMGLLLLERLNMENIHTTEMNEINYTENEDKETENYETQMGLLFLEVPPIGAELMHTPAYLLARMVWQHYNQHAIDGDKDMKYCNTKEKCSVAPELVINELHLDFDTTLGLLAIGQPNFCLAIPGMTGAGLRVLALTDTSTTWPTLR